MNSWRGFLVWPILSLIAVTVVGVVFLELYVRSSSQIPTVFRVEITKDDIKPVIGTLDPLPTPTVRVLSLELPEAVFVPQPTPTRVSQPGDTKEEIYLVKPGDSLSGIAARYDVSMDLIAKTNLISDPSRINVGQELVIPGDEG